MSSFQYRCQIFGIKTDDTFRSPRTPRIRRITPRLILKHNHINRNTLFLISRNELAKIIGIRLQITCILYHKIIQRKCTWKKIAGSGSHISIQIIIFFFRKFIMLFVATHRIILINLHPAWRRPWRNPKGDIRIISLSRFYIWNKCFFITLNIKVFQIKISGDFVTTIPIACIIIGVH